MKKSEAYNKIVEEYLSKCKYCGCDGCIAQFYCISNGLRADRYPQKDCSEKVKKYLRQLRQRNL